MIKNTAPTTSEIVLPMVDNHGNKRVLKLPTDFLQKQMKAFHGGKQGEMELEFKDFKLTLSSDQAKEVILQATVATIKQNLPIPKILEKVLLYQYDPESLAYNEPIKGRDTELSKLRTFLTSKSKSNCMMIGNDGVGRSTIVKDFARQIYLNEGEGPLKGVVILRVNLNEIPKHFPAKQTFYHAFKKFVKENREKIILHFDYVEELDEYPEMQEYFMEELIYHNTRIIGEITASNMLEEFFSVDMMRFLNFLIIDEPEIEEVKGWIEKKIHQIERESGISISDSMIHFAIMTSSFLAATTVVNPELSLDVLNYATMNAKINGEKAVTKRNILSFYNINFKLMDKTDEKEKMITAYHEIGHYVVSKMVKNIKRSKNAFVSILPIESSLGITASYDETGKQLTLTREYYLDEIAYSYGGRTGEYLYTKTYSSGASADIESASTIAEMVVLSGGLAEDENINNKSYMWGGSIKAYLLTDDEKKKLSDEMDKIRAEGFKRAQAICNENADLIAYLVYELMKDGILLGSELDELVKKFQVAPESCMKEIKTK